MEVKIPYKPRNWAKPFHESLKRWIVLVLHRRAGKTTALVNHLQRSAVDDEREKNRLRFLAPSLTENDILSLLRERMYGLVLPTYKQAKYVAWDMLKYFSKNIPNTKPNEADLLMKYPNGCKLGLFGADNPDSLRGIPFWGLGFDEFSQQPPNIFSEVLSKNLADHLGYGIFAGTIKGKNQLFRTYEAGKADPEWFSLWQDIDVSLKTEEGPTITLLKIALEDDKKLIDKGLMTKEEFEQEWYLSPTAAFKGAIYSTELYEAQRDGRIKIVPYERSLLVHTVWDLGKGANMAVGFYQRSFNELRKIDYWEGQGNEGLPEAIKEVLRKPYIYGKHFAPHDIETVEIGTSNSRKDTAKELGIDFTVIPKLSVEEGIHMAKLAFYRLWVDEVKCQKWLDAISQYRRIYDDKLGMYKDIPLHDWTSHAADEWRYASVIEDQMTNENLKDSWILETNYQVDPYS